MTEPPPCYQPPLPKPAVNLALRVMQLRKLGNGAKSHGNGSRHKLEIIFNGEQWLLIVDGASVEDLGVME